MNGPKSGLLCFCSCSVADLDRFIGARASSASRDLRLGMSPLITGADKFESDRSRSTEEGSGGAGFCPS